MQTSCDPTTTARWFKSSYSANGADCVEVAITAHLVAVRDSKNPTGPILTFTRHEWAAFLAGVKDNEFDPRLTR